MNKELISTLTAIALSTSLVTTNVKAETISSENIIEVQASSDDLNSTTQEELTNNDLSTSETSEDALTTEDSISLEDDSITTSTKDYNDTSAIEVDAINITQEESSEISTQENITETTTITLGETISFEGNGVSIENNIVKITAGGSYTINGTLSDGQVIVNSNKEDVNIILNGANISSSTSSAIYIEKAGTVTVTLADGTINTLSDATNYIYEDETADEPDAALFSKSDLVINGTGTLNVNGNYNTGIRTKDDLVIESGTINVTSVDDGIKGKDSVIIKDGNITINAGADGIKSTNSTKETKGYVQIDGGVINITSANDGVQAETNLIINAGDVTILSGNGSEYGEDHTEDDMPGMPGDGQMPGNPPTGEMPDMPSDGQMPGNPPTGEMPNDGQTPPTAPTTDTTTNDSTNTSDTTTDDSTTTDETTSDSKKGLKAGTSITINGGTFNLNCADDSIHSDGDIIINTGTFTIETGDDGIHADNNLEINDGDITITKAYEGLEASYITINDGYINITTSDDGINAANSDSEESIFTLTINGGYVVVDASGDGLDTNGSIFINGGTTIVNGPEDNNNGALDYDVDCIITDGILIAAGSAGMVQTPSESSTQNTINLTVSSQESGSLVHIESEDGEDILTFAPSKKYQSVVISTPNIETGKTYTAYTGGTSTGTSVDGLYSDGEYTPGTEIGSITITEGVNDLTEEGVIIGGPGNGQPGMPGQGQPGIPSEGQPEIPGGGQPTVPGEGQPENPEGGQPTVPGEEQPDTPSEDTSEDDDNSSDDDTTVDDSTEDDSTTGDDDTNSDDSTDKGTTSDTTTSTNTTTTTTTPQTGDTTNILPYIFALTASALAIMLNFSKKLVKKNQ